MTKVTRMRRAILFQITLNEDEGFMLHTGDVVWFLGNRVIIRSKCIVSNHNFLYECFQILSESDCKRIKEEKIQKAVDQIVAITKDVDPYDYADRVDDEEEFRNEIAGYLRNKNYNALFEWLDGVNDNYHSVMELQKILFQLNK